MWEPAGEGLTCFVNNWSFRRQTDVALRESERRYRFVFEEVLTCNLVSSPEGEVYACNLAFATTFGFASIEPALTARTESLWRDPVKRMERLNELRAGGRAGDTPETDGLARLDRLAQGAGGQAQVFAELLLRGQPVAGGELPGEDHLFDLVDCFIGNGHKASLLV